MSLNYTPAYQTPVPTADAERKPELNYTPAPTTNYTPAPAADLNRGEVLGASTSSDSFDAGSALSDLGYSNKSEFKQDTGYSSVEDYLNTLRKEEGGRRKEQEAKAQEIGSSFDPIFSELDRQLAGLSGRQQEFEGQIARSAQAQLGDVESRTEASKETLEQERSRGLRDLEGDIRNQLQAAGRVIGAAGAGASSAVGQATEAISRIGQQARSDLNQGVGNQLKEIESLALQQKSDINKWKQDKLFEITDFFSKQLDALNLQKSGASRDKQRSISELEFQIQQDYMGQLRGLDQQLLQYNQAVDNWQNARAGEFAAFQAQQQSGVQGGIEGINTALDLFGNLTAQGVSDDEARQIVEAQGLYLPQSTTTEDSFSSRFGGNDSVSQVVAPVNNLTQGQSQQVADDPFTGLGI